MDSPPHTPTTRQQASRTRRGFTLAEMVVALVSATTLMMAGMSVLVLSIRTLPQPSDSTILAAEATVLMEMIATDASECVAVTFGDDLVLTVPDRTGDGVDDDVVYEFVKDGGIAHVLRTSVAGTVTRVSTGVNTDVVEVVSDATVPRLVVQVTSDGVDPITLRRSVTMHNYADALSGGGS